MCRIKTIFCDRSQNRYEPLVNLCQIDNLDSAKGLVGNISVRTMRFHVAPNTALTTTLNVTPPRRRCRNHGTGKRRISAATWFVCARQKPYCDRYIRIRDFDISRAFFQTDDGILASVWRNIPPYVIGPGNPR